MSNIYSFLPFVAFLSNAVLLGVGLHRGMSKRVHRDYVYFMTCVTAWTFGDFLNWNWSQMPHEFTMTVYRLQVPAYIFLAYFFMRFIYSMVGKEEDWFYKNFYVIPLTVSLVGVFTPYMVYSYTPVWWGLRHEPGILFIPAAVICIFAPAQYALCILLNFKTAKDKNERSQRKLMIVGCCFVLYVGMYTDLVAPHFMGEGATIQAAGSTVAIMAYCMHRAISKYYMLPFSLGDLVYELFQSSEQGVLIVNSKEEVTDMNPVALRMLCLDRPGEYQNDTRRSIKELIPEVVESSYSKRVEIIRERNGQDIVLKLHINKHSRVAEQESGWVIVATDVTKERTQKERLEGDLAQARERSAELEQQLISLSETTSEQNDIAVLDQRSQLLTQLLSSLSRKLESFDLKNDLDREELNKLKISLSYLCNESSYENSYESFDVKKLFSEFFNKLKIDDGNEKIEIELPDRDFLVRSSPKNFFQLFSMFESLWRLESVKNKLKLRMSVEDLGPECRLNFYFAYPNREVKAGGAQEFENKDFKSFEELLLQCFALSRVSNFKAQQKNPYEKEISFDFLVPLAK